MLSWLCYHSEAYIDEHCLQNLPYSIIIIEYDEKEIWSVFTLSSFPTGHRGGVCGPPALGQITQPQADLLCQDVWTHLPPDGAVPRGNEDLDWYNFHWGWGLPWISGWHLRKAMPCFWHSALFYIIVMLLIKLRALWKEWHSFSALYVDIFVLSAWLICRSNELLFFYRYHVFWKVHCYYWITSGRYIFALGFVFW